MIIQFITIILISLQLVPINCIIDHEIYSGNLIVPEVKK